MRNQLFSKKYNVRYKIIQLTFFTGLIFLIHQANLVWGQEYSVESIPQELKDNAKAVIRSSDIVLKLISTNKAQMQIHKAITILNENGLLAANLEQHFDKYSRVNQIDFVVYDGNGKKVKKIKSDDIKDISAISGYSIYEDNRMKYIDPNYQTIPFTVEYSYNIVYTGILDYPDFYLFNDYNISVQHSTFTILSENDHLKYRVLENNITPENKISEDVKMRKWSFSHYKPLKNESFESPIIEIIPVIQVAPNQFKLDEFTGNSKTWEQFGKWIYTLNEGRTALDESTRNTIKELVKLASNRYDSVKFIYEFMQNKTRYVSIQIGIGGWQAFEASTVDKLGYGDCKALTNYTKALLETVGIKSYYALVRAGRKITNIIEDFPSNQFNHTILCVPSDTDTLWLECTDQNIPCGYLGIFTDDRKSLLITKDGGKLVNIKTIDPNEHFVSKNIAVELFEDGFGTAEINGKYSGLFFDLLYPVLKMDDRDKRKEILSLIEIPSFDLINFSHSTNKTIIPTIDENINLSLKNYASLINNRYIFRLNLMNVAEPLPYERHKRKSDIDLRWPLLSFDTVLYQFPKNYKLDVIPEKIIIQSEFGEYISTVDIIDGSIQYTKKFRLNKGSYSPELYNEFIDFFDAISAADERKISLLKISE